MPPPDPLVKPSAKQDLFILHAEADRAFVRAYLVPELGLDPQRLLLSSALPPGMSIAQAIEEGILASRVTVAVISPAFLNHRYASFGEELACHHAIHGGRLVPLWLSDCNMPLHLSYRVILDCRDQDRRDDEVARLRQLLELPEPEVRDVPCPYPGMRPYTAENAALFCGRTEEVDDLVRRLAGGMRALFLLGPSGSGKSSLLQSGVAARLQRSDDPVVGEPFEVHLLRPGSDPAPRLAAAAAAARATRARTLVIIDHLEELFTLADDEARAAFLVGREELCAIPTCHVALVLRADFQGALMDSALWPWIKGIHRQEVAPLRGESLREAIAAPARRRGVDFEPALLESLVADAAQEPGALPLIQEALIELWGRRARQLLTLAAYRQLGRGTGNGLAAALAARADVTFTALDELGQQIARRVFLRLVSFGEGRADTRRQQPRSALGSGAPPDRLTATLSHLIEHRLLTADGDGPSGETLIDLAHEALIASWPRLQAWIREHRQHEQRRRVLELDAGEWRRRVAEGRSEVGLLDEGQLHELAGWLSPAVKRELGVDPHVEAFLAASRAAVEARDQERAARTAELVAEQQKLRRQLARYFVAQGQGSLVRGRGAQAVPYLIAARELGVEDAPIRTLFRWALRALPRRSMVEQPLDQTGEPTTASWVATLGDDGVLRSGPPSTSQRWTVRFDGATARVFDARTEQPTSPGITNQVPFAPVAFAVSPDGTRLALASADQTARIWNVRSGQVDSPLLEHPRAIEQISWSPNGSRLATVTAGRNAFVWEVRETTSPPIVHAAPLTAIEWSPDGSRLATSSEDLVVRVWSPTAGGMTLQAAIPHAGALVTWCADGQRLLALNQRTHTARLWNAWTGEPASPPITDLQYLTAIAQSPTGALLAIATTLGNIQLWDAQTAQPLAEPLQHLDSVEVIAWHPDGTRLTTAGHDHTVRVWDPRTSQEVRPPLIHPEPVTNLAWSPDGARLAILSTAGVVRIWEPFAAPPPPAHLLLERARCLAWSPDGKRIAVGTIDQTAKIWNALTGRPETPPLEHRSAVTTVAWSADGTRLATGSADSSARLWDARTGATLSPPLRQEGAIDLLAWSSTGTSLATASSGGRAVHLWDTGCDAGTLDEWRAVLRRCPYRLDEDGILLARGVDGDAEREDLQPEGTSTCR